MRCSVLWYNRVILWESRVIPDRMQKMCCHCIITVSLCERANTGEKDTENEVLLYYNRVTLWESWATLERRTRRMRCCCIITGSLCERAGQHWREGHGEWGVAVLYYNRVTLWESWATLERRTRKMRCCCWSTMSPTATSHRPSWTVCQRCPGPSQTRQELFIAFGAVLPNLMPEKMIHVTVGSTSKTP